jgi:hypothetical protein
LPGNPYDGHTLGTVIPQMEALIGNVLDRCITNAGYRGHNASPDHKFKVYTAGQKRRVTPQIKREFKRRAAIELGTTRSGAPVRRGIRLRRCSGLRRRHRRGRTHGPVLHDQAGWLSLVLDAVAARAFLSVSERTFTS